MWRIKRKRKGRKNERKKKRRETAHNNVSFNVHVDSVVRMREDNRDFQACGLSSIVKGQADDQARKR